MEDRDLLQSGYRYALSLTHNEQDAEDIVQDVWLRLYINSNNAKNKSLFYTSIRNRFIDIYRRKKLVIMEDIDDDFQADQLENDLSIEDIKKCLEKLRPEEREVLYLNCVEEYSASEIGEMTNQSRSTVLSIISRGKRKFINTYNYLFEEKITKTSG